MNDKTPEMPENDERPLFTFALFAYNQEKYIREAVEGALTQTYSPLQIILSDDCSSDRTFEIMQEMVGHYSGPHEIHLNKNEKNLGIGGHVNRIMTVAQGDLIIAAAGDDISLSHRTRTIYEHWTAAGAPVCVIYSNVDEISENGTLKYRTIVGKQMQASLRKSLENGILFPGSSECWHRKLFDLFGPLPMDLVNEDAALWFRAKLLNSIISVDSVLVRHRHHSFNTGAGGFKKNDSGTEWITGIRNASINHVALLNCHQADLSSFLVKVSSKTLSNEMCSDISLIIARKIDYQKSLQTLIDEVGLRKLILLLSKIKYLSKNRFLLLKVFAPNLYRTIYKSTLKIRDFKKNKGVRD